MVFGKLINGLAGNFSEQNKETLMKEHGHYLLEKSICQTHFPHDVELETSDL